MKAIFSRPVRVARLARVREEEIAATEAERAALAGDLGLLALDDLSARFTVRPWRGDGVQVEGTVRGLLTQACVLTLEPVPQHVDEAIRRRFHPDIIESSEVTLDPEADDPPEPLPGDVLDLGSVALEQFILGIDPYPRAPGASYEGEEGEAEEAKTSPFAALAKLARSTGNGAAE